MEKRIVVHEFVDPINSGVDQLVVRYDNNMDFYRLFLETETGGSVEVPRLNTLEMENWLAGTGLTQSQLVDLVADYGIWG